MERVVAMDAEARQHAGQAARERMAASFSEALVVNAYLDCMKTNKD
jgi:hypothetical protein